MTSDLNTSGTNINNSFALSQRKEDETNNDIKRIDSSLKKHVKTRGDSEKKVVEDAVNNSKTQIQ